MVEGLFGEIGRRMALLVICLRFTCFRTEKVTSFDNLQSSHIG